MIENHCGFYGNIEKKESQSKRELATKGGLAEKIFFEEKNVI